MLTHGAKIHRPAQITGFLNLISAVGAWLTYRFLAEHSLVTARPSEEVFLRVPASCDSHLLQCAADRIINSPLLPFRQTADFPLGMKSRFQQNILQYTISQPRDPLYQAKECGVCAASASRILFPRMLSFICLAIVRLSGISSMISLLSAYTFHLPGSALPSCLPTLHTFSASVFLFGLHSYQLTLSISPV